jgi:hypothetical protein
MGQRYPESLPGGTAIISKKRKYNRILNIIITPEIGRQI